MMSWNSIAIYWQFGVWHGIFMSIWLDTNNGWSLLAAIAAFLVMMYNVFYDRAKYELIPKRKREYRRNAETGQYAWEIVE